MDHIASRYIIKRYTRNHYLETTFDRHDKMFLDSNGETTAQRVRSILSDIFKLQRSAIMSGTTMERAKTLIATTITELDKIPHDISLPVHRAPTAYAASTSSTPHRVERMTEQEEHNVSAYAPPVSTIKDRRKKCAGMTADIPQPHFQRDKRNEKSVKDMVYMTQVTMLLHVREHSNNSKMVSSNNQEGSREEADMEMQQQNMGCSKFP
jgi:hypothetical protein